MTKIRKSRRGFTLLEIVIVVAIIVIVAGAAFLGVTVTLTRANAARNELIQHNGDNFEVDARNEIEHLKADPNFTPIQEYTPDGETDEDDEDDEDDDDEDDGEDEEENGGGPVNNQPGHKNSPTPTPTNTPTPTPTNTPTPTPKPTTPPSNDIDYSSYPDDFVSSRPSYSNGAIYTAPSAGSYAPGVTVNSGGAGSNNIQIQYPGNVDSVVFHIPDGLEFGNYNQGVVTDLGDGYYRINFNGNNPSNLSIWNPQWTPMTQEQADQIYVSEIVMKGT